MIGSEFDKTKSECTEGLGFEVLKADSVVKPISKLSNMDSETRSGSSNEEGEKSNN